jgi:metal-sulfur cluster biosynthetic enzyme
MNAPRHPGGEGPAMVMPYLYEGPEALRAPIEQALRRVVDPEVALTIVDVGLVYGVSVTPASVQVTMTMTSAACPVTDLILDEVGAELDGIAPPGAAVDVHLVWEPAWTPERLSPRARLFMGW